MIERPRLAVGIILSLLLLFPFLVLTAQVGTWQLPNFDETAFVFGFTLLQAFLSAGFSLVIGILGALGLFWLARATNERIARGFELFALLPNATPVLLLLLAVLKFFPWARGLAGIVFVHTLLNAGLVMVSFVRLVRAKLGGMAELAWVEGASGPRFFRQAAKYLKWDLALVFLFVFALCFSSFAVPLILGGSRATTIETLIYQKIRISGEWSQALGLAFLQMAAVIALGFALRTPDEPSSLATRPTPSPLLSWRGGLAIAAFPSGLLVVGLFQGLGRGIEQLSRLQPLLDELPQLIAGSAAVALLTGVLVMGVLFAIAYVDPQGRARKVLMGYAAPSSVLTGFALLLAWRTLGWATYVKIGLGLTLVTVPSFYRLQWDSLLQALQGQRQVASVLGAGNGLTFVRIVGPQLVRPAFFLAGLAALWAWGDYALSSVVAERSVTLAMVVQGLMESYRLDAATALVWIVIAGAGLTLFAFWGAGRVLGQESQA